MTGDVLSRTGMKLRPLLVRVVAVVSVMLMVFTTNCCMLMKKGGGGKVATALTLSFTATADSNDKFPLQVRFFALTDSAAFFNSGPEMLFKRDTTQDIQGQLGILAWEKRPQDIALSPGAVDFTVAIPEDKAWKEAGSVYLGVAANYVSATPGSDRLVVNLRAKHPKTLRLISTGNSLQIEAGDK